MAGNFTSETTWTNVTASTIQNFNKEAKDNWHKSSKVLSMLMDKSVRVRGGTRVSKGVQVGPAGSSGVFTGYQTLSIEEQQFLKRAETDWRNYYTTVSISHDERVQNTGEPAILDLLAQKFNSMKKQMRENILGGFFSDGTDYIYPDARTLGIDGLKVALDDGTNYQHYAGLDRNNAVYGSRWQGNYADLSSAATTYAHYTTAIADVREQTGKNPDVIITTFTQEDHLRVIMEPKQRYVNDKLAILGFKEETYNIDGVPIIADSFCPAKYIFGISWDSIKMYISPEGNMKSTGLAKPIGQHVWTDETVLTTNIICDEPRANFIRVNAGT